MSTNHDSWLEQLQQTPWGKDQGITWLTPQESQEATQNMRQQYANGIPLGIKLLSTDQLDWAAQYAQKFTVVGQGPLIHRQRYRFTVEYPPLLLTHEDQPEKLFFSMGLTCPSYLYFPLGSNQEEIAQNWAQFFPVPHPSRLELPLVTRGWFAWGTFEVPNVYHGGADNIDVHTLGRIFTLGPFLDRIQWGSTYTEDEFNRPESKQEPAEPLADPALGLFIHSLLTQDENSVFKETYRSKYSRSQISIEVHPEYIGLNNVYVFEIRHQPNPYPEIVEALNEKCGTSYPTQLPLDVLGIVMGFNFFTKEKALELLQQQTTPEAISEVLSMLIPLMHDDIGLQSVIRPYLREGSFDGRGSLYNLFIQYNFTYLLEEACFSEPEPGYLEVLTNYAKANLSPDKLHPGVGEEEEEE